MQVKTNAIVISATRYQEKSLIVKCLTQSDGLKSYFVRDAFSGRRTSQKIAYFQPLTLLEIEAAHKNKGTPEHLKEIKLSHPYVSVNTDIVKSTIAIFLSEVLHHSIHEEEKNESLYNFLETALLWFDNHAEVANFHLITLLETTKYLGFYPDRSDISLPYFEMTEGVFTRFHAISCLSETETGLLKKLMELKFDSNQRVFTSPDRQTLLKIVIDYYSYHISGFRKPRSLDVLKEVFS
ncbi:MAG TPA: DNA repair protein RecO [Flavobacterium sp.]